VMSVKVTGPEGRAGAGVEAGRSGAGLAGCTEERAGSGTERDLQPATEQSKSAI